MLKILLSFVYEYNHKGPARVENVSFSGAMLKMVYFSESKRAQPILFFMYYINPIFILCGMVGYVIKIMCMFHRFS